MSCKPINDCDKKCLQPTYCNQCETVKTSKDCGQLSSSSGCCEWVAPPVPGTAGAPCKKLTEGISICDPGLVCNNGVCVTAPTPDTPAAGTAGGPCIKVSDNVSVCNEGLVCNNGVCVVPGTAGAPCIKVSDNVSVCNKGLVCGNDGMCRFSAKPEPPQPITVELIKNKLSTGSIIGIVIGCIILILIIVLGIYFARKKGKGKGKSKK